jgi:hypothetical protein
MAFAVASPARAHDGYEPECCNEVHCRPIPPPARDGAYWVLPDGRRFLAGTTRHSSVIHKTGFHLCEWRQGETIPNSYEQTRIVQKIGTPVCLYVPDAEH